jgi:DNA-binding transcriptional LysR family regulator
MNLRAIRFVISSSCCFRIPGIAWKGQRVELKQLRYFVALAEEMHFGRGARRLRIAQPTLSKQISALERELEAPLFSRAKKKVALTPAGTALLDQARLVLAQADNARSATQATARGYPTLSIAVPPWIGPWTIKTLLTRLAAHSSNSLLHVSQCNVQEQVAGLRDGRIGIGMVPLPFKDSALSIVPFARERFVLALPRMHRLASAVRITTDDLAEEPIVTFSQEYAPAYCDLLATIFREEGVSPRIAHHAGGVEPLLALSSAGLGIAIIPQSLSHFRPPEIAYRPFPSPGARLETALVYRTEGRNSHLRKLIEAVRTAD